MRCRQVRKRSGRLKSYARVKELDEQGCTQVEIAELTEIPQQTVSVMLKEIASGKYPRISSGSLAALQKISDDSKRRSEDHRKDHAHDRTGQPHDRERCDELWAEHKAIRDQELADWRERFPRQ